MPNVRWQVTKGLRKGKWYVRRFDPDTVQNGYTYFSIKEEVFIYWAYVDIFCGLG